jgi:hypothetical protein
MKPLHAAIRSITSVLTRSLCANASGSGAGISDPLCMVV